MGPDGIAPGDGNTGPVPAADARPADPLLSLRDASKSFGAVQAIVHGSIDLAGGEAHALVGENGAGKSTLVKILAGVYQPDTGSLFIDGSPVLLHGPADAQTAGIAVIYQEPTLFPDLSVEENIFMGRQPMRSGRRIDRRLMRAEAMALFERLGVRLDPGRVCRGLSIADQQIVEIGKALSLNARVIVMDEPTAAQVLDTPKYRGKIALTGLGTPDSLKKFVADGTVQSFELWNPANLGYLAAYAAVNYASKKITNSAGQSFTAGKLGSFTVGADSTVLLGPPFVFTKANISQFNF